MTGQPDDFYNALCSRHRWDVPERYNIAADVCDRHPAKKLAMVHEDPNGNTREVFWGELQNVANRFAHILDRRGVTRGARVAMLLSPTPETAAAFFGTWKIGGILLSLSTLYGDEGIRHRLSDSEAKVLVTNAEGAERVASSLVDEVIVLNSELLADADDTPMCVDTAADEPAQSLLHEWNYRAGEGHPPCSSVPTRTRRVRLLPRRTRRRALPRNGRMGMGGRDMPTSRAMAPRRHAVRASAQGRI